VSRSFYARASTRQQMDGLKQHVAYIYMTLGIQFLDSTI